jgi:hypothetical protein
VSWSDVSWADVSWLDSSKEDAVLEETGPAEGVVLDPADAAELAADPDLNVDPTLVDEGALALLTAGVPAATSIVASTTSSLLG